MEDHPGIVFRDGPAGRRAALAGGPDVWEVIETLKGTGLTGEPAIAATAKWGALSRPQIRAALCYYADFQKEVDERIALNRQKAELRHATWERRRRSALRQEALRLANDPRDRGEIAAINAEFEGFTPARPED